MRAGEADLEVGGVRDAVVARRMQDLRRLELRGGGRREEQQQEREQWFFRTTAYADELLDALEGLRGGWPDRVLTMQRNWIGRSTGTEADFSVEGSGESIRVFTTRVDTIFGATA